MSLRVPLPASARDDLDQPDWDLARSLTQAGSSSTFQIFKMLVDRERVDDAFRAYGYFRWLDDTLDLGCHDKAERIALVEEQKALVDACYRRETPKHLSPEEVMLANLIERDRGEDTGLQCYIRNLMAMMAFDAERRGRLISEVELNCYTRWLAVGVTENLHYFIGHGTRSPRDQTRYLAVTAAHITHMLRDTLEDVEMGYFNVPREYLDQNAIKPDDVDSEPYRAWIQRRAQAARAYFKIGHGYISRVESIRCRMAGHLYSERFEGVLDTIEQDGYRLRETYPAGRVWAVALRVIDLFLKSAFMADGTEFAMPVSQSRTDQL